MYLAKLGTRHVQALLMAISLVIAYGMRSSLSVAIVAMTNVKSVNSKFKVWTFTVSSLY